MNIKDKILIEAGLVEEDEIVRLDEGIRFFKNSKRLNKAARKIAKKAASMKESEDRENILKVARQVEDVAKKFKQVEEQFEKARKTKDKQMKQQAKMNYETLKQEHLELVKMINKESIRKALKGAALGATIASVLFAGAYLLDIGKSALTVGGGEATKAGLAFSGFEKGGPIIGAWQKVTYPWAGIGTVGGAATGSAFLSKILSKRKSKLLSQTRDALSKIEKGEK